MIHPERDSDLLLLVHGELSPAKEIITRWHVAGCLECRQRMARFQSVSQTLGVAIRGRQLPRRFYPATQVWLGVPRVWLLAAAAVIVLVFGTLSVMVHTPAFQRSSRPAANIPCRPDLPSDKCR